MRNLDSWAPQVKDLVDNHAVRILMTGSSSLRIEAGRDSLAGRIATLEMGPLLIREIAELRFGSRHESQWGDKGFDRLLSLEFWNSAVNKSTGSLRHSTLQSNEDSRQTYFWSVMRQRMLHIQFSLFCFQPGIFSYSVSISFISSLNRRI